jgi:hypothetical protein
MDIADLKLKRETTMYKNKRKKPTSSINVYCRVFSVYLRLSGEAAIVWAVKKQFIPILLALIVLKMRKGEWGRG